MQSTGNWLPVWRGMSIATVGMGFFSLVVFWWYPFGLILSTAGLLIGITCLIRGTRGLHGENFALIGTTICAITFSTVMVLTQVLRFAIWDH